MPVPVCTHTENKVLFASAEALEEERGASRRRGRAAAPGLRHLLSRRCPLLALQRSNPPLWSTTNRKGTGSAPHTKIHASSEPQNVHDSEFCSPEKKHPQRAEKDCYNYFKWPHSPSYILIVLSINVHISWRNWGDRSFCTPPGESRNLNWPSFSLDSEAKARKPLASFRSRLCLLPLCGRRPPAAAQGWTETTSSKGDMSPSAQGGAGFWGVLCFPQTTGS